jgi:hypothetical protein
LVAAIGHAQLHQKPHLGQRRKGLSQPHLNTWCEESFNHTNIAMHIVLFQKIKNKEAQSHIIYTFFAKFIVLNAHFRSIDYFE